MPRHRQQREPERSGLSQVGDVLQKLASVGAGVNQVFNNGGVGSTFVELRELGPQRTLILVNGRRYAPDGNELSGAVDLNSIPTAIVERIEVLKDGASPIYGSDAIAGVINIVTVAGSPGWAHRLTSVRTRKATAAPNPTTSQWALPTIVLRWC